MEIFGQKVKTTSRQMVGDQEVGAKRVWYQTTLLLKDGLPFMESDGMEDDGDLTYSLYADGQCVRLELDRQPDESTVALMKAELERGLSSSIAWEYEEMVENPHEPAPWVCTHGEQSTYLFGAEPVVSTGPDNTVIVWNERLVPKMVAGGYWQLSPFAKKEFA